MTTEIFVENRRLDISADISSLLTFAIDDVKDFSSRQTTFSKTIVLPGTANNNAIFGNIFETGISNDYDPSLNNIGYNFNASVSARCIIFQDNLQTFKGTLRLLEIDKDKGLIEYEVALNGDLTGLNVALSNGLLTDLDFSSYNRLWNVANIQNSWNNTPGSGVYFPLIDYGTYSDLKHNWDFRTFRPALYVKEYIDKMFAAANFRRTCDLFSTPRFRGLVVPHNQKQLTKLTNGILSGTNATTQHLINHNVFLDTADVDFGTPVGGFFSITGGGSIFTYTGTTTISTTISLHLNGHYNFFTTEDVFEIRITVQKNGVDYYYDGVTMSSSTGFDVPYTKNWSVPMTLATGDVIRVHYVLTGGPSGTADVYVDGATIGIESTSVVASPLDYGEMIEINECIPRNIRQVDFLVSIVKLFNLYVYESQFDERLIIIKPYVDFYDGSVIDWTFKFNRDAPVKIKPLSEVNSKIYNFNFKDDSDYYNDLYKKRYNQGYGSEIYDSAFEFSSQTNKLELIFAATPLVGYVGEDKIYPTIFKRTGSTTLVEETVDSVIRILQTKKLSGVRGYKIKNVDTILASPNAYGYAGHFDDPNNPNDDLNFGIVKELFYTLTSGNLFNTQFNTYWSAYMAEITDKDSKMLTAKFYLTPKDIFSLRFSTMIHLDGVLFRLNKITDYNATVPSDCIVELLKVINTTYTYPPGAFPDLELWKDHDDLVVVDIDGHGVRTRPYPPGMVPPLTLP